MALERKKVPHPCCRCWWSENETNHALCRFLCPLAQAKTDVMLFLVYFQIGLLVFLLSLDLVSRLESSYGTAALLWVLLPVAMPHIIGLSSSCALSLFSPVVTSALMFFSVELHLAPTFLFLCTLSLHCGAVIGYSAAHGLWAV